MCGIAGYISDAAQPLPAPQIASRVNAMQAALVHRGPDHQGLFASTSGRAVFCHTRLAIIDLSDKANQPMLSDDQRYALSLNGEVYNHKKLRERLLNKGHSFKTESDTEVVLKLLIEEGPSALQLLRGMFCLAFWDEAQQSLLLARDPLGIKPVYYCARDGHLAYASEVRALLKAKLSSQKLSSRGLQHYLLRGSFSEPDTAFTDVKLLPAGTYFVWKKGKPKLRRYWSFGFSEQPMTSQRATEITRMALEHSVRAHLVSDVPVGLFLSGGIDSTAILAIASKLSSTPINTYSIAFEDTAWNEGEIAKKTAEHFGAVHTEWVLSRSEAEAHFDEFLDAVDQPTIDGFNTFCIAKLANKHGEKVVLSGLGADELFGGYPSFEVLPRWYTRLNRFHFLGPFINAIRPYIGKILPTKLRRGLDILRHANQLGSYFQAFRGVFSEIEAQALSGFLSRKISPTKALEVKSTELRNQVSELELTQYCRNQLLRDSDVFSMYFGLELRVPFVDKVLVEQIAQIPADLRLETGKRLLVDSVSELPDWVLDQPKKGFRFPFDEWFEAHWNDMPTPKVPKWINLSPWYRRWSLTVLQHWLNAHSK